MRNKILFFILLTFCLGLSAQHRMANTAVTEQTGKKVSKLLKTNHRMLNPISPPGVYIADPEARQMPDGLFMLTSAMLLRDTMQPLVERQIM